MFRFSFEQLNMSNNGRQTELKKKGWKRDKLTFWNLAFFLFNESHGEGGKSQVLGSRTLENYMMGPSAIA